MGLLSEGSRKIVELGYDSDESPNMEKKQVAKRTKK